MTNLTQELRAQTAAVKLKRTLFGVRKRLHENDRNRAAQQFSANAEMLSASKKLLDTKDPTYKKVTGTIGRARRYWRAMTVFYPVKGIRLIRKELVEEFEQRMQAFAEELKSDLDELCEHYNAMKQQARQKLGDLYRQADYPGVEDLREEFSISWEYPSVDPPNDLKELNPKLYEQETARVRARFEEAMATAEQALTAELRALMDGLCDRLQPNSSGKKKSLTASTIAGFTEFIDRFRKLNCQSGSELESLVEQAAQLTKGIDPAALKKAPEQQGELFSNVSAIRESLDQMVVDAPTRKIDLEDE